MSNRVHTGARWAQVPVPVMHHILDQMVPSHPIPDELAKDMAPRFLAPGPGPLHFATQQRRFGEIIAMLMTVSAVRVLRGPGATVGITHVAFLLSGAAILTPTNGDPILLGPGDVCSVSDWSRFEVEASDSTRGLHLLLPESRLLARGVRQPDQHVVLGGDRSLRSPLRSFALSVSDPSWHPSPVASQVVERTIEDLVVGMFLEHQTLAADHAEEREALVARATAEIARYHPMPALTPGNLAELLSVSLRHLQRAFESSGITIAHSITQARLRTAEILLSCPDAPELTLAEVAFRAGFSSTFELRSAFRNEHGVLPSEFRSNRQVHTRA